MGILQGKTVLVTGVLVDSSIAFHVAKIAQEEGAKVILTSFGRALKITTVISRRLPEPVLGVVELDVSDPDHVEGLAAKVGELTDSVDGVLHAIGFAPQGAFDFLNASWEDVSTAVNVSAYSLKALAVGISPLLADSASIVGLTFDATLAWPVYDWMGVAKAAFESTNRYCARDLGPRGVRCNLVAAGPIRTTAAKSIPGFATFEENWDGKAPLGWNVNDPVPTAKACVALLSDWFPATTGEIVHVDGGVHCMGI
ncbi:MAG: enoyl-ACP reductase FabI [Actinomycetales bacterium]